MREYHKELEMIKKNPKGGIQALKAKYKEKFLDRLKEISPVTARMVRGVDQVYTVGKNVGETVSAVKSVMF
jgi:hypothetical protein